MTSLTEDLAAEKLQRMTNDELLAHLIERLPAIRKALDGGAVSQEQLGDIGTALGLFASAIKSGEQWTATCEAARTAAWEAFDALRAPQSQSSERDLARALERQCDNMAFLLNHTSLSDAWFLKFDRELKEDRAFLASRQEKKE